MLREESGQGQQTAGALVAFFVVLRESGIYLAFGFSRSAFGDAL
jgi:hypothetical protein